MNCKMKQTTSISKNRWGCGWVETLPSENMHLCSLWHIWPFPLWSWGGGEGGYLPSRNIRQCRYWEGGPRPHYPSWWSFNVTALTTCRRKQSKVFGKLPSINSHMGLGLKPSDAKLGRKASLSFFFLSNYAPSLKPHFEYMWTRCPLSCNGNKDSWISFSSVNSYIQSTGLLLARLSTCRLWSGPVFCFCFVFLK